jgi:hypothetical protein
MKFAIALSWMLAALAHAGGLKFTDQLKEIHADPAAATVTADFPFTNSSSKPVSIANSDPGCSCLKVEVAGGKLKYAPGESGLVRATFDMGNSSGTIDKDIALWIDDDPTDKPSVKLTVSIHIPVLISVDPKTVKWEIGAKADPQTIHIQMAEGKPIRVLSVKSSSDIFSYEVKAIEEGKRYDVVVTPRAMDASGLSVFRIETDCQLPKHRLQQAFAVIRKP